MSYFYDDKNRFNRALVGVLRDHLTIFNHVNKYSVEMIEEKCAVLKQQLIDYDLKHKEV